MLCGMADAATLCREGSVPTSKIYLAMEKLAGLGLVQLQRHVRRCSRRSRQRWSSPGHRDCAGAIGAVRRTGVELQATFTGLQSRVRGRHPFVDLALVSRATIGGTSCPWRLPGKRILSYMEAGDLMAIDAAVKAGSLSSGVSPRMRRNMESSIGWSFGFSYQSAGQLVEFLRVHRHDLRQVTGVRYSRRARASVSCGRHETVVLPLDHPFIKEGRFASLLVRESRTRGQPGGRLSRTLAEGDEESAGDPGGSRGHKT